MPPIAHLAKKHSSFLVIVIGAFSVFAASVLLKKVMSPNDYGEYSLLVTFFQLLFSFGLVGFEQVFLRISEVNKKNIIETDKTLSIILVLVWILFGFVSSFLFTAYFSEIELPYGYFLGCTLAITFSMFLFNVLRLNSDFTMSQLLGNSWKIVLLLFCLVFMVYNLTNIELFVKITTFSLGAIFIAQLLYGLKKISFSFKKIYAKKSLGLYAFQFFISLATLTFIGYSDRFIVKNELGSVMLGEYFFLATIFFFPYALIQGYIGFKELVAFKKQATLRGLSKKLLKINGMGILLGIAIVVVSLILNKIALFPYIAISENTLLILIFVITGIVKLNYSLLSALLGARGEIKTIRNANLQSFLFIAIIAVTFYSFLNSVEQIAFAFLLFWISRAFIWNYNLRKQFKTASHEV